MNSNRYEVDIYDIGWLGDPSDIVAIIYGWVGNLTTHFAQSRTVVNLSGTNNADTLTGGVNNDTITGGAGNDAITGGVGADVLTGGSEADTFIFNAVVESSSDSNLSIIDTITDLATTDFIYLNLTNVNDFEVATDVTFTDSKYIADTGTLDDSDVVISSTGGSVTNEVQARAITVVFAVGTAGNNTISGGDNNDTITGGAGADALTGGSGADRFIYTAFAQGGNVVAGNSSTALTAGDVITDFDTGVDKIDISAVATGTASASNGTGNAGAIEVFDSRSISNNYGVGVITVDYDFSANNTASGVIDAILAGYRTIVVLGAGDIAYFAILDAGAAGVTDDFYNIFAIQNNTAFEAVDAGLKGALINVTHVASTTAGEIVVASDFIL